MIGPAAQTKLVVARENTRNACKGCGGQENFVCREGWSNTLGADGDVV